MSSSPPLIKVLADGTFPCLRQSLTAQSVDSLILTSTQLSTPSLTRTHKALQVHTRQIPGPSPSRTSLRTYSKTPLEGPYAL